MRRIHSLDEIDQRIIALLEKDARQPTSHIARAVGLSAASVADRIGRMRDTGVIDRFTVKLDAGALGLGTAALVKFQPNSYADANAVRLAATHPAVRSCYKVLGDALLVLLVRVQTAGELDSFLVELSQHGKTETTVIVNSELEQRPWFARDDRDPIEMLKLKNRGY